MTASASSSTTLVQPISPTTLLWFTHDLRLHDNPAIHHVNTLTRSNKHRLLCLYCIDSAWFEKNHFGTQAMGSHRQRFLLQSLTSLDQQLRELGQQLVIAKGEPRDIISDILARYAITTVVGSQPVAYNEQRLWQTLKDDHPQHTFVDVETFTLFTKQQLTSALSTTDLPSSFSKFRRLIESNTERSLQINTMNEQLCSYPKELPPVLHITLSSQYRYSLPKGVNDVKTRHQLFTGGATAGLKHLNHYFSGAAPSHYKETRNALGCDEEHWQLSGKFSPWLANGCLSARQIVAAVNRYEQQQEANESTYWIIFELLWREYFQWYAREHQQRLFFFKGIQATPPLTSFYPQRFQQWCSGNTPWPLVNACMNQLNHTGFLSNRGRQIVASCLVYELNVDWRCGAAYFEQQLIDYDAAANWGNWQYIAGVGADPRGGRHFNIEKQQHQYDPNEVFIKRWGGDIAEQHYAIDSVDAADWPLSAP